MALSFAVSLDFGFKSVRGSSCCLPESFRCTKNHLPLSLRTLLVLLFLLCCVSRFGECFSSGHWARQAGALQGGEEARCAPCPGVRCCRGHSRSGVSSAAPLRCLSQQPAPRCPFPPAKEQRRQKFLLHSRRSLLLGASNASLCCWHSSGGSRLRPYPWSLPRGA